MIRDILHPEPKKTLPCARPSLHFAPPNLKLLSENLSFGFGLAASSAAAEAVDSSVVVEVGGLVPFALPSESTPPEMAPSRL